MNQTYQFEAIITLL